MWWVVGLSFPRAIAMLVLPSRRDLSGLRESLLPLESLEPPRAYDPSLWDGTSTWKFSEGQAGAAVLPRYAGGTSGAWLAGRALPGERPDWRLPSALEP